MSRTTKHLKKPDFNGAAEIRTRDTLAGMLVFKTKPAKSQTYGISESDSIGVKCIGKRDAQRLNLSDVFQIDQNSGGTWPAPTLSESGAAR